MMKEPRFVVVGTGRHGSHWVAEALTNGGIPCGHEAWWGWTGIIPDTEFIGDSSWFAAPHLNNYSGKILQQIRNPLSVVNSLVKSPDLGVAWGARAREIPLYGDAFEVAASIVLHWRRLCDRISSITWRLEDGLPEDIGEILGRPFDFKSASDTLLTNWHGDGSLWDWDTLPTSPLKLELMRLAERDGYL